MYNDTYNIILRVGWARRGAGGKAVENLNENYYITSRIIEQRVKCCYLNGRLLRV